MIDLGAIRALASTHIQELGLHEPPFDYQESLRARQLCLLDESLEAVLKDSGLPPDAQEKIDGFIDLNGRIICLRGTLHRHQFRIGVLHEVAHDLIPWQRDLLFYCPIFSLPHQVQLVFEREATAFAVECTFFADRFREEVLSYPAHLSSAMTLSDQFETSYESTFRHYVESQSSPCLLLVSTIHKVDEESGEIIFATRQFIRSVKSLAGIPPGHHFRHPEITKLVNRPFSLTDVIEHEVRLRTPQGIKVVPAQSFWNTYKLFTLMWFDS